MKKIIFFSACLLIANCAMSQSTSQLPAADKIIAIVGDKIILQSDLQGQLQDLEHQSTKPLPPNAPCALLEQMMAQKALVLQAERDSLPISEDEVQGNLENRIRGFINMYGSQQKLEEVAGMSIYQLKEKFRVPIRENMLADAMRKKIVGEVKITPSEVEAYFNKIPKDSLPFFESEVQVGQIVIDPKASREIENYTLQQMNEYRDEIVSGQQTFKNMMILYSDDPSKNQNDGIFTVSRGQKDIDPDFLAAAFRLKEGEISPVIKSKFGYHIIQMVSREGDNVQVRDLLKIPPVTTSDVKAALNKLDSIRSQIIAGNIDFGEAASEYSDDPAAKLFAGMITTPDGSGATYLTVDQLDPSVLFIVDSLKPGHISPPSVFTDPSNGKQSTHIIFLKSRTAPHRENLRDDYSKIQDQALQEKQYAALDKWFTEKMPTYYIMIDDDYESCTSPEKWAHSSAMINQ